MKNLVTNPREERSVNMVQAAKDGDVLAVRTLLSQYPDLVHAADEHLKTPLHWAAEGHHDDVRELLGRG